MQITSLASAIGLGFAITLSAAACRFESVDPLTLGATTAAMRSDARAPGAAMAYVTSDEIITAVDGTRRVDTTEKIALEDRFHLGSNAKAMLATLIAMTVEDGQLSWDTRVADVLPEVSPTLQPAYSNVELQDLLAHRAGLFAFTSLEEISAAPPFQGSPIEQRVQFAVWAMAQPPATAYGTSLYSNADYVIAAAMLERATGSSWDSLMEQRLFRPLGIDARFGWPAASRQPQPWGHVLTDGVALPNDPDAPDSAFPAFLTPVGHVSMSVRDYARFIQLHLRALRGQPKLLREETFAELHRARGDYSLGWAFGPLNGVPSITHQGGAGTFDALVVLQPQRDRAVITLVNAYDDAGSTTATMVNGAAQVMLLADKEAR